MSLFIFLISLEDIRSTSDHQGIYIYYLNRHSYRKTVLRLSMTFEDSSIGIHRFRKARHMGIFTKFFFMPFGPVSGKDLKSLKDQLRKAD